MDSGCGIAVASYTRGLQFKSSHRENLYRIFTVEMTKIKKQRPNVKNIGRHTIDRMAR